MLLNFEIFLRKCMRKLPSRLKVLVVAADPRFPTGSRGDQAMLTVLAKEIRHRFPGAKLQILTEGWKAGEPEAIAMGFQPVGLWKKEAEGPEMRRLIASSEILFILGADVMDGHYDDHASVKRWKMAEMAHRMGVKSVVLGCSFNNPHPAVVEAIRSLDLNFRLNFRDEVSFAKFRGLRPDKGQLVADIAFLMEPESHHGKEVLDACAWVQEQRAQRREVLGFNINNHLFSKAQGTASLERMVEAIAVVLEDRIMKRQTSVVLLPHDFRPYVDDRECLKLLLSKLSQESLEFVHLLEGEPTAGEIKSLVVHFDYLVTSRMHLAVAALGRGVPVGSIVYQGKFEGLMRHFKLSSSSMITPEQACAPEEFMTFLNRIADERDSTRSRIAECLPKVIELAKSNLT